MNVFAYYVDLSPEFGNLDDPPNFGGRKDTSEFCNSSFTSILLCIPIKQKKQKNSYCKLFLYLIWIWDKLQYDWFPPLFPLKMPLEPPNHPIKPPLSHGMAIVYIIYIHMNVSDENHP